MPNIALKPPKVQGTKQAKFAKHIFVYNYRIFDRYDRPVASLAVLADTNKQWKPTSYGFTVLGCKLSLEFPVAKLTDYEKRLDELLVSDNAFGWITAVTNVDDPNGCFIVDSSDPDMVILIANDGDFVVSEHQDTTVLLRKGKPTKLFFTVMYLDSNRTIVTEWKDSDFKMSK